MAEFIFLALRTTRGMELAAFAKQFSVDFFHHFGRNFEKLHRQQLVQADDKQIWLTERGMKFGNVVFSSFLPD